MGSLHSYIARQDNVAITHKLLSMYTEDTRRLLGNRRYTLILDEAFETMTEVIITRHDFESLVARKIIKVSEDGTHLECLISGYKGKYENEIALIQTGRVIVFNNRYLFWHYPPEFLDVFDEVIVLTYMFDCQYFAAYCQQNNFKIRYIGVEQVRDGRYYFCSQAPHYSIMDKVPGLIEICEDKKLNKIGAQRYSLSSSWFKSRGNAQRRKKLGNNIYTFLKRRCDATASNSMWSIYASGKDEIQKKGFISSFVPFNSRATNEHRDRDNLAYCVDIYCNPNVRNFFKVNNAQIDEDEYALSVMIQWIWRSAIRDGKPIRIYIPSLRMRLLLKYWLWTLKTDMEKNECTA